jgi:flagellar hook-associated protein 1 FlgK
MLGLLGTLDLARRSLAAQMAGVETAGHNLANVNTPGYSRQRVNLQTGLGLDSPWGMQGSGVQAASIQRIVDDLLNGRIQTQGGTQAYWTAQQTALQSAQSGLNEFLNGTGSTDASSATATASNTNASLSAQLANFFTAAQALTQPSGNTAANRDQLVKAAQSVASTFSQVNTRLDAARTTINDMMARDTAAANTLLTNIATLNRQISTAETSGGTANDLRDQRDQALQNLGKLVNFTSSTGSDGSVSIAVSGQTLVSGQNVQNSLELYSAGGGQMLMRTATGGTPLTLSGGSLAGAITARDTTLAAVQTGVDALAGAFITQVNAVHAAGFTVNGTTGNTFFNGTGAGTITVNAALVANADLVQSSGSATAADDTSVALALAQLAGSAQSALGNQTFSQAYAKIVGNLGHDLKTANDAVDNEASVTAMLSAQRNAISGVSTDEEMTTLLAFQRAYTASAELLKTVDQMIQTTLAMKS